jgi:hypothetical protein
MVHLNGPPFMPIENITNQCQMDAKVDMALVRDVFVIVDQVAKQAHNTQMDELRVVGQKPEPMVLVGHEQCIGHVGGASPMSGSLPRFNNVYDMVDVDNVMRVDVERANEEEAIVGMPELGDELEGWSQEHMAFEEASRVPLFKGSTLSILASTFLIMNCCHTRGTSNIFIFEMLGLLKKTSYPTQIHYPFLEHEPLRTMNNTQNYLAFNLMKWVCSPIALTIPTNRSS